MAASPTFRLVHIIGARPNVMKVGPLYHALAARGCFTQSIIHTGQHYDPALASELLEDFNLPPPHHNLGVGDLSPAFQYAAVIDRLARVLEAEQPDLVIVYGDVRSTPAAAIAAYHLNIPVAHYEGGLRAFDRVFAEEFHRITADAYSDLIFTTEPAAHDNVVAERKSVKNVFLDGDLMCDAARTIVGNDRGERLLAKYGISGDFAVFTSHHAINVDTPEALSRTLAVLECVQERIPVVFPVHPRTEKQVDAFGLRRRLTSMTRVKLTPALRYAEFIRLVNAARVMASDSGSLAPECAFLRKPMLFLHHVTERPLTIECGVAVLTTMNVDRARADLSRALSGGFNIRSHKVFDGYAAGRIATHIEEYLREKTAS